MMQCVCVSSWTVPSYLLSSYGATCAPTTKTRSGAINNHEHIGCKTPWPQMLRWLGKKGRRILCKGCGRGGTGGRGKT